MGIPTTLRSLWMVHALTALAMTFLVCSLFATAAAQSGRELVVGQTYRRSSLYCSSPAARNALIVLWQGGLEGPLPLGCAIETIAFIPLGVSARTTSIRPFTREGRPGVAPGEFIVAEALEPPDLRSADRIYVFIIPSVLRLVNRDGRPPQQLNDP
jgi:hypothetical protein